MTVTRNGTHLYVDGVYTQFVGFNAYGAVSGCEGSSWTKTQMDTYFSELPANGLTRTWCFPGTSLTVMDQFITSAANHGQHVVLVLDNDFSDCTTSGTKSSKWYSSGYKTSYLAWATTVAARYKGNPCIAFLECVNEAGGSRNADGVLSGSTMKLFYDAAGHAVKAADPGRLVGTGDSAEFLYKNGKSDYQTASSAANIDILSLHDYESDYVRHAPVESSHLAPCLSAAVALNKPLFIGELNDSASKYANKGARATGVVTSIRAYLTSGVCGALIWNRTFTNGKQDLDYDIISSDPLVTMIQNWS